MHNIWGDWWGLEKCWLSLLSVMRQACPVEIVATNIWLGHKIGVSPWLARGAWNILERGAMMCLLALWSGTLIHSLVWYERRELAQFLLDRGDGTCGAFWLCTLAWKCWRGLCHNSSRGSAPRRLIQSSNWWPCINIRALIWSDQRGINWRTSHQSRQLPVWRWVDCCDDSTVHLWTLWAHRRRRWGALQVACGQVGWLMGGHTCPSWSWQQLWHFVRWNTGCTWRWSFLGCRLVLYACTRIFRVACPNKKIHVGCHVPYSLGRDHTVPVCLGRDEVTCWSWVVVRVVDSVYISEEDTMVVLPLGAEVDNKLGVHRFLFSRIVL